MHRVRWIAQGARSYPPKTRRLLFEQLEPEREACRRADTINAQLTRANAALVSRTLQLEAPQKPTGAAEAGDRVRNAFGKWQLARE